MEQVGLTSGEQFLRDAARAYFEDRYERPNMHLNIRLHKDLAWTPALRFTIQGHVNVFVEPSDIGPYPQIFALRSSNVRRFPQPIAIYSVCPEGMTSRPEQRRDMKRLEADGFGLIIVDADGHAKLEFPTIPLIQIISSAEFKNEIRGLPKIVRQRVSETYEDYCGKPVNGVKSITEVIEGLVQQAGNEFVKRGFLPRNRLGNGVAGVLDALHDDARCNNVRAELGGVRNYIRRYRNPSHHWPRGKKKAYEKYADCRHGFLEGIKQIQQFRLAMKGVGLSGNLPR